MLTPKPRRIRRRTGPSSIQRAHRAHRAQRIRRLPAAAALTTAALALAGCSLGAGPSDDATDPGPDPAPQVVQVVTHDSFAVSEDLIADFEAETGYTVELSDQVLGDGKGGVGDHLHHLRCGVGSEDLIADFEDLIADFEAETGYTVELSAPGDGGSLVNQLILTRD